jgi:hypothetical protein
MCSHQQEQERTTETIKPKQENPDLCKEKRVGKQIYALMGSESCNEAVASAWNPRDLIGNTAIEKWWYTAIEQRT